MPNTFTSPSRRPGRGVLAASAVLGLALSLTACTIDGAGNDDDEAPVAATTSATVTSDQPETSVPDAPEVGVDQLVLNAQDVPELGLAPVPAEEIAGGVDTLGELAAGIRVEPAHCAEFSQDALLAQAEPGVMAIQAGQSGDTAYAVSVTTLTESLPESGRLVEDCPTMSVTIPLEGTEMTSQATNTLLPLEAPEGVEHFTAISQENSMDMMGQQVRTGNILLTGVVRGIGISVTAANGTGTVPDASRDAAMDAFARQVEKVRNA